MISSFEELDFRETPLGELSLRRRRVASLDDQVVYEVKLGDAFLMSSLFHEVETALAEMGLAGKAAPLDVAVGGLGLGYTAVAVLRNPSVRSLVVVEALPAVIEWHRSHLVPLGAELTDDSRCSFLEADFFELAARTQPGLDPAKPNEKHHAILLDIDHSPRNLLSPAHADFYSPAGIAKLAEHLHPGGVFGMWSDDPPDDDFLQVLALVFPSVETRVVRFPNPLTDAESASTVYLASRAGRRT